MGLFDFAKNQFIEVIEYTDDSQDLMVYRFPVANKEIKMNAQLTVRESQMAVFVNEGEIADIFSPGRYQLTTQNMPILTKLKSWKYGFNSPFKAEVYFVNTKQFLNQKWGTTNPIMMRDREFGPIRLRAFGGYSFKVNSPEIFLKEVFGTNSYYTVDNINEYLRKMIISSFSDSLSESKVAALDLASNYDEISKVLKQKVEPDFNNLGLTLISTFIENISLPEEVEKVLDKRTSMGILGDLNQYTKYQVADSISKAAENEGMGGAFTQAGVGMGMGQIISDAFKSNNSNNNVNAGSQNTGEDTMTCPGCNRQIPKNSKFCPECGSGLQLICSKCGAKISGNSKFCTECGNPLNTIIPTTKKCLNCNAEMPIDTKFCPECGKSV